MQFSIEQKVLATALGQLNRIVPAKATHPILTGILLEASPGRLKLTAFDLSCGLTLTLPVLTTAPGKVVLPGKMFAEVVSKMPKDHLMVTVEEDLQAEITAPKARFVISGLPAEEFPELPVTTENQVIFPEGSLQNCLGKVTYAASTDDTKQVLTGCHFKSNGDDLELAATTGHILACHTVKDVGVEVPGLTVARGVLQVLESLKIEGDITVNFDQELISFAYGGNLLVGRLLQGAYPMYKQLIPAQYAIKATVKRKELISAIQAVSIFDEKNHAVIFTFKDDQLEISSMGKETGYGNFTIDSDTVGTESFEIGFNAKYLIAGLSSFEEDEITISMNSFNTPVVVSNENSLFLVMPVTVVK
jgi:DNA polymerase-3 subunit beta